MSFLDLFRPNAMPGQNTVAPITQPNVAMFGSMAPPQPTNWMQAQQSMQPPPQYRNLPVGSGDMSGLKGWAMPKPDVYIGGGTTDSPTPMAMGMMNTPAPQPTAQQAGNPRLYSPRAPAPTAPPSPAFMPGAQQSSPSAPSGQETQTNWMAAIASALDTLPALGNPGASGGGGSVGGGIASMPGEVSSPGQGIGGGGGVPTNWMGGGGLSNPLQPTNWKQPSLFGGK
ncbi:MAG: hypothetical protein WC058_01085 [Phycisphaeraceae bacterium]